jgi:DNA-directed RNA polymerase specialized sigma24 family protein
MKSGGCGLLRLVITEGENSTSVAGFIASNRVPLERALVARYGLTDGMDAAAHAVEYAFTNWERVSAMGNPSGYLFRVGQSHARRWLRSSRRMTALVADPTTIDNTIDVDLQRALIRLPWMQRVAIVLVHAHGHTYAEAGRIMDLPATTITNHVNRGLARLRRSLDLKRSEQP